MGKWIDYLDYWCIRTAAGIRTAAMTAAQALLKSHLISSQQVCEILPQFLPQVISCLDDDNTSTRVTSCKVLTLLFQIAPAYFTIDQLHQLFSDLLKRLDDSSNETRLQMSKTLIDYFSLFPQDYDSHLYKAHVEVMYSGLLVHLDDTSYDIQVAILSVLQSASVLSPSLLKQMAESVKDKHRTDKLQINQLPNDIL
jgi:dynein assembly factor 5